MFHCLISLVRTDIQDDDSDADLEDYEIMEASDVSDNTIIIDEDDEPPSKKSKQTL